MTFTSNEQIKYIFEGLVARTLPKPDWTHAAHFAAAIAILSDKNYDAFKDMPVLIQSYNEATGVPNTDIEGYHHTITMVSLGAAQNVLTRAERGRALYQIVNDVLASDYGQSIWLLAYWTQECLFSSKARKVWVEPDIKALPFEVSYEELARNVLITDV